MARYSRDYTGERRTEKVTVQLTPSEREALLKAAAKAGASLSQHARELCLRRSAAAQIVAGTRRSPEAKALMNELTAIGNNVNQLTRIANTTKSMTQEKELKATTQLLKAALSHVLTL